MQIHLIDGTWELFRSFYGAPSHQDASGREVGAVRGLLASLQALLRRPDVTHVGIAFDAVIESFRNDLWAGYKTSAGIDPALWQQFPLAEEATRALGFVTWAMVEFEADDALATMAARAAADPAVTKVVLCSPDKDLAQCVRGTRVVQWDRSRDRWLDEAGVQRHHGVPPAAIPDLLALVGDPADGIPGIAGWGAVSARKVLAHYGRLEAIPDDPTRWQVPVRGAARLAAALASDRAAALLWKRLATLRTDVPLAETPEDLRWTGRKD